MVVPRISIGLLHWPDVFGQGIFGFVWTSVGRTEFEIQRGRVTVQDGGHPAADVGQEGKHGHGHPPSPKDGQAVKQLPEQGQETGLDSPQGGPEQADDGELVAHVDVAMINQFLIKRA